MYPYVVTVLHTPLVHVALTGFVAGVAVDLHAFLTFKDWKDVEGYKWSTAAFRGFQGAIASLLTAGGISFVS